MGEKVELQTGYDLAGVGNFLLSAKSNVLQLGAFRKLWAALAFLNSLQL